MNGPELLRLRRPGSSSGLERPGNPGNISHVPSYSPLATADPPTWSTHVVQGVSSRPDTWVPGLTTPVPSPNLSSSCAAAARLPASQTTASLTPRKSRVPFSKTVVAMS
ncbi:hypothetical protein BKA67DRAFT_582797 [Truncatella angustata]|uniref:Uncharacterized protein n=1 Tax=Truncatella angustata TaxID=152316 RepID=A0A9P8RMG7_9PEZI|nr:uncharacterized protein BKA67DRAFT_582797 [Truncatella angustata]KAH6645940.1 hypothetical protein BKA67DRAFT_582797 [Truncatella angustata]